MGKSDSKIECHVVSSDVPLLISRETMKQFNIIINTCNDKVKIDDDEQVCGMTSSGQYLVPIMPKQMAGNISAFINQAATNELSKQLTKQQIAVKLHRVLAHAS